MAKNKHLYLLTGYLDTTGLRFKTDSRGSITKEHPYTYEVQSKDSGIFHMLKSEIRKPFMESIVLDGNIWGSYFNVSMNVLQDELEEAKKELQAYMMSYANIRVSIFSAFYEAVQTVKSHEQPKH